MSFRPDRVRGIAALGCMLALGACGGGGGGGGGGTSSAPPTVSLSASPTSVDHGQGTQLTWSTTNASSCTASDGWSGAQNTSGSIPTSGLLQTTTFTLSCAGAGGTAQASVTVTVHRVTMTATPQFLRAGMTSVLSWTSTGLNDCNASGAWSGARPTSGTETVGPISQNQTYQLICTAVGGSQVVAFADLSFRPGTNVPPRADAGFDQSAFSTATVSLTAGNSSDLEGGALTYHWQQVGGPAVALSDPASGQPSFVAPGVAAPTVVTIQLTVTDDEGASATDTVDVTVEPIPNNVTVSGSVSYETVPHGSLGRGLNYAGIGYTPLYAEVLLEAVNAQTQAVVASAQVRANFTLTVPRQTDIALRVTAQLSRQSPRPLPHWDISVRDLDPNSGAPLGAVYSYTGPTFNSGAGLVSAELLIPSGWDGSGQLIGARAAAPFAILDAIQQGMDRVLEAVPDATFRKLTIDWGPNNEGGSTFYSADSNDALRRIVLAGERDVDTDEYDPAVVLHEFGHYVTDTFARDDNFGGSHSLGDRLDMRVAFSEGFATAFAGMSRRDQFYRDSFGANQRSEGFVDLEQDRSDDGWFSESSVQEMIWDAFDSFNSTAAGDDLVVSASTLLHVLRVGESQTDAMTSIFPFMVALKQQIPDQVAAINALLAAESIVGATMDAFGSTETNAAGSANVLPIYRDIPLGGSLQVRSTNEFGTGNKLSTHRYLRLALSAPTNVRFFVTAADGKDADIKVFQRGVQFAPDMGPANENFLLSLPAGDFILDVYECGNAECNDGVTPGPTDITVSAVPE